VEPGIASAPFFARGEMVARHFPVCSGTLRADCVVDGDTIWLAGQKIRISDINTPEVSEPQCAAEARLGARATRRLQSLLNQAPFEVRAGFRDEDVYGRKLRTVHRNGRSIGAMLVAEGLAHEWNGYKESWCG
jgi:endonuclease YncB( thermonuclease family)